ncbi:ATP-grasp peptide maturase system methyltransferase [Nonomuraea sp. NPDC059023]|uniref:ATP-grasp peptide maturase system methyltransferase n=1 Tax=unclassified Nonomuraea TaxID=2593643 RepID=UPI00368C3A60
MTLAADLRRKLAADIASAPWRSALEEVPRELFIGDAVYRHETGLGWVPVRRAEMSEEEWLRLVYTDETWVTQLDGVMAEDATGPVPILRPTSSSTFPGLVISMLEAAGIGVGDQVLEIGTGTGYSTALMCHRLGAASVASVEVDPEVATRAKAAITAAGYAPTLVTGDGLLGHDHDAPYDRLIATCAVRTIPLSWLRQMCVGGTITTPMMGWLGGAAFAHLQVTDDGSASGHFLTEDVYFMTARPHQPPPRPPIDMGRGDQRDSRIDPAILKQDTALFVAQLGIPQAQHGWAGNILVVHDVSTGSQADVRPDSAGGWTVHQHGPIKLWDEAEEAILTWQGAGSPHQSGFGLTVAVDEQRVWLGDPAGPSWNLPA